jgi:membrane-bound ClpP family serine protease
MNTIEEILMNPNVVYLILVLGFMLTIMALIAPGTGILELTAFFMLLIAGWSVYNLNMPINYWALAILLLGVIPFLVAVRRTKQPIYLVISIISLVIGSAYLFQGQYWWQPAINPFLALIVSVLAGGFLWFATTKALEAAQAPPTHDLTSLIGAEGEAKSDIHEEGSVQIAGELWTAQSEQLIPRGSRIRVIGREGFILHVESANHHQK